jgi:predicted nucleic acid-binding protein
MISNLEEVFADTSFWVALVVKQDQGHQRAQAWSLRITQRIITSVPVLLETANMLSKPAWRAAGIALMNRLQQRPDVDVIPLSGDLWQRGWALFSSRPDKSWSLTDCVSFVVMHDRSLTAALTADEHFRQAGFRALLLDEP